MRWSGSRGALALALALAVSAVAAGLVGAGLTVLLHGVQHLAFGYRVGPFNDGVFQASPTRRVVVLAVAGVVAGAGWWLLQRYLAPAVRVRVAVQQRVPMRPTTTVAEGLLQIVVVALGASLGRESAPRRVSAAVAQLVVRRLPLTDDDTRLVLACAAGGGLAAVYGVPIGGAVFATEVLLRSWRPGPLVAASLVGLVATLVARLAVPVGPVYRVAFGTVSAPLLVGAVLAVPFVAAGGETFRRATQWAVRHRATGWQIPVTAVPVFTGLGVLAVWAPSLLGNGRGPAELAFLADRTAPVLLLLAMAKPLVTAACLRTGATGGLLTPAFATGALLGAALAAPWSRLWPGAGVGVYAVLVATGVLAVTLRAPVCALVLGVELTGAPPWFVVPAGVTVAGGVLLARAVTPWNDDSAGEAAGSPVRSAGPLRRR